MKITIDCDRRIKKLKIEFADEYDEPSEMEFSEPSETSHKSKKVPSTPKKEKAISFEIDEARDAIQEVIEKPIIEEKERTPLVVGEMQNLEL